MNHFPETGLNGQAGMVEPPAPERVLRANLALAAPYGASRWIPDNSALACFRENPEMFRLKYRLHLAPARGANDKMLAGSAIHAARNVLYDWRQAHSGEAYTPDVVERAVAVGRAHRGEAGGARDANHVERVVRMYAQHYAVETFRVLENECYVEARIHASDCGLPNRGIHADVCGPCRANGTSCCFHSQECSADCFDFCGIQDAVIGFADSSEYVMDTKSTGAYLNDAWETTARLGDQFVGYVAMRRANGARCDGFLVDGIHMRDPKPRKDGTRGEPKVDESDFVRVGPVPVPEWRVERWARDVRYTLRAIAELEASRGLAQPWPMYQNWPYGKVDAYREFYETAPELHASVALQFEVKPWNPRDVAEERKVTP